MAECIVGCAYRPRSAASFDRVWARGARSAKRQLPVRAARAVPRNCFGKLMALKKRDWVREAHLLKGARIMKSNTKKMDAIMRVAFHNAGAF